MQFWQIVFVVSCSLVFYNYAGYALIAGLINKLKRGNAPAPTGTFYPTVSFIVAAYNEGELIREKIANSISLKYPKDKIEYIFITDGSTDQSPQLVRQHPGIILLHQSQRQGKSAALNRAVASASHDILIFNDANTVLNPEAIMNIVKHYEDPGVGGVAGEKKVISSPDHAGSLVTMEGTYWKYESFLKKIDSEFYSVVGAAGELFSLRKKLYVPIGDQVILDDFVLSLRAAQAGYRIIYEPEAFAMELPSFSLQDEQKRKVRIAAGGFQAALMLSGLLKFWQHPRLTFLYVSHRLLRWTLSPVCVILIFISNLVLALGYSSILYQLLFIAQIILYIMALLAGSVLQNSNRFKLFKIPYYFIFMNVSVVLGFIRFLRGKQSAAWEKAKRSEQEIITQ